MIRFLPDTWRDALLRPIAMAAPDAGVYVEVMAPDFRFLFVILLLVVLAGLLAWRRRNITTAFKPTALLLTTTAAAFVPWLATTGNGRYFIPFLLAVGPLCLAVVHCLPLTRGFRLTLAAGLVAVQAFAVVDSNPLRTWGLVQWRTAPFFQIDLPRDMATKPGTYVTLSTISYSLIAPLFPSASRWMNLSEAPSDPEKTLEGRRVHAFLGAGNPLTLLVPSIPGATTGHGLPNAEVVRTINALLAEFRLSIAQPEHCRLLRSGGLASMQKENAGTATPEVLAQIGFWACPLQYSANIPAAKPLAAKTKFDAVFKKVETLCPRFFRPGEARTTPINGGELRHYRGSDMKVYVLDDGSVLYKYYRTFSPQLIGSAEDVLSGKATMDCSKIRGRSGLPWEREI